jgi:hypothetical protein
MESMSEAMSRTKVVLTAFVAFSVTPFAIAATKSSFWQPEHSMAPVVTVGYLALVLALVVGRYRWAWVVLFLFNGFVALSWLFDSDRFAPTHVLGLALDLAVLLLLISEPMRRRLRRSVRAWAPRYQQDPG